LKIDPGAIAGMKVTVMGLGLNGGGLASALFFAGRGAEVTVTDLRGPQALAPSIERLGDAKVRLVLGRHEEKDFASADLVIKNPAVSPASPFLKAARAHGAAVETDLSVFLALAKNPVLAVTGSKGKSTTASAIAFGLARLDSRAKLGGNITVSPLSFLDELAPGAPVVLELSSWQLGDLRGRGVLAPVVSAFTVILPDHLDKYAGMADYVADKKVLFEGQGPGAKAVFNLDDPWQESFPGETRAQSFHYSAGPLPGGARGAWLEEGRGWAGDPAGGAPRGILGDCRLAGAHNRMNLLCAGLCLSLYGMKAEAVEEAMREFPGVEHRMEMFLERGGIRFYNDSAATIPHATVQAVQALPAPLVLIAGGTDKNIDFAPLRAVLRRPEAIVLLAGTATDKIRGVLDSEGVGYEGPFDSLLPAVQAALARARPGGAVLFSPGCTSFGMFLNEFDRGARFKQVVTELTAP
jgi:UDP-N-acetylmuramoylalanine--D-glutamate ligase